MDDIGVAHQENLVVFLYLFNSLNALARDVQQHGVPNGIETLVGHFPQSEKGFGFFAEGGGSVDACVEFAHNVDKLL